MSFSHILIAIDGSKESREAARTGFALATTLAAAVATIYAAEPPVPVSHTSGIQPDDFQDIADHNDHAVMRALRRSIAIPVGTEHFVRIGHPAEAIVETARRWGADLIVIGSHGRTGLRRMLLGSVAESVLREAPCPVLVVRGERPGG